MNTDPRDKMFHDEDAARDYFESQRWPDGKPFCAHCGATNVHRLEGKSHRPGLLQCNDCLGAFTVTTKSVMESSHVPLTKWAMAFHKMAASKKGISAKQMQRELALGSYRTAWFLCMRVREAMGLPTMQKGTTGPLGGEGKTVESDETFVGGKAKNVHKGKPIPKKHAVHALVELGVDGFSPVAINFIKGLAPKETFNYLVGGEPFISPRVADRHTLDHRWQSIAGKDYLVVNIRLFANLAMPLNHVVVGVRP